MDARDEFYRILSEDLTLYGKRSVLYQYLEQEQERKAAEGDPRELMKARSFQLRIRYYKRQLKTGALPPEAYLKFLLGILLQKPQFGRPCRRPDKSLESRKIVGYNSEDPQPLIQSFLRTAFGQEVTKDRRRPLPEIRLAYELLDAGKGAEYERMIERLEERGILKPPCTELQALTDAVLDVALAYDIREFFFGTAVEQMEGYSVSKRKKKPGGSAERSRAVRTDKSLKLLDFYCREKGKTLFGAGADNAAPGDMECDALYRELLKSGNEKVFVPLLMDPATGCGICIIGKVYFMGNYSEEPWKYQKITNCCAYGVLFLNDDYGYDVRMGYDIGNEFGQFPDFNSARFDGDLCYEKVRLEAEESIREANGKLPQGVSMKFRRYFPEEREPEEENDRQEILQAVADCERELRESESALFGKIP